MSLDYYLYCRKEYDDIITCLYDIINKYEIISDITTAEVELDEDYYNMFKPESNKDFFIDKLKNIKQLKRLCDIKILELCNHDFVNDFIDIGPDKCKCIKYCKICEYTQS